MAEVPARPIFPMIAFRDSICITHDPWMALYLKAGKDPRESSDIASPYEPRSA